jgi:hypothetical protein
LRQSAVRGARDREATIVRDARVVTAKPNLRFAPRTTTPIVKHAPRSGDQPSGILPEEAGASLRRRTIAQ